MTTKWLSRQGNPMQGCLHAANQQKKKKKKKNYQICQNTDRFDNKNVFSAICAYA